MSSKVCRLCHEDKPLDGFALILGKHCHRCKDCVNKLAREKRALNPKKLGSPKRDRHVPCSGCQAPAPPEGWWHATGCHPCYRKRYNLYPSRTGAENREKMRLRNQARYAVPETRETMKRSTYAWMAKNKVRIAASQWVAAQVKAGKVTPEPCEICLSTAIAHFDDPVPRPPVYRWLCRLHSKQAHGKVLASP